MAFSRAAKVLITSSFFLFIACQNENDCLEIAQRLDQLAKENTFLRHDRRDNSIIIDRYEALFKIHDQLFDLNTAEFDAKPNMVWLDGELVPQPVSEEEKLIQKIDALEASIEAFEKGEKALYRNSREIVQMKELLEASKNRLEATRITNEILKKEKDSVIGINYDLSKSLDQNMEEFSRKRDSLKALENEMRCLVEKVNTKFMILVAKKESKLQEITNNTIFLNYKKNHVVLLTEHPSSSYSRREHNGKTVYSILDQKEFWGDSKFLIIRIKRRNLKKKI